MRTLAHNGMLEKYIMLAQRKAQHTGTKKVIID